MVKNLDFGEHVFYVRLTYGDSIATSSKAFNLLNVAPIYWFIIFLILFLIILFIIILIWFIKHRDKKDKPMAGSEFIS